MPKRLLTRRRLVPAVVVLVLVAAAITWLAWPGGGPFHRESAMVLVRDGVRIDTTTYVPDNASARDPVPAVLLAHGFGGSKLSVATDAERLAGQGYLVVTWSAEGFGASGGQIHLDSPDYEVADAKLLVDRLAARTDVIRDSQGDPRVAAVGGSYGGALALLLAGYDQRVDAVVAQITWNDLAKSFFPNGVFKKLWAGLFFSSGMSPDQTPVEGRTPPPPKVADPRCGRFAADLCDAYLRAATTGQLTPELYALLEKSSPASILSRIKAPTLLVQGQTDSLFPLSEADANAAGIPAPVKVTWFAGGHDAGSPSDDPTVRRQTLDWLNQYAARKNVSSGRGFSFSNSGDLNLQTGRTSATELSATDYPGLDGVNRQAVALTGGPQPIAAPPNGTPAAISSVPGLGSLASRVASDVPGQTAYFPSQVLSQSVALTGSARIQLKVASTTGSAVLFVRLEDLSTSGQPSLPQGLVTPVRLTGLPKTVEAAKPVTITLSALAYRFQAGHQIRVAVSTTDQAYAMPTDPASYTVAVASPLTAPQVPTTGGGMSWFWPGMLALLVLALAIGVAAAAMVARWRRRRQVSIVDEDDSPLVVRGLRKEYADGFVAARDVSFSVRRNQVVGLLGPNGAGKTTLLRTMMGLIRPTAGEILLYGHRVEPGAPVLSRIGSLVEGTGFLPHLSGLDNLRLYWRATGRPARDARMDEALELADLGAAVNRAVRTYSQGMRQRLAIAQAMLGRPELLVLDEPTNGLDPPQIAEMRRMMRAYANDGRSVLVSSHLLAEVEQTCTHVVVMNHGEVVADGPVDDVTGESTSVLIGVDDPQAAMALLRKADEVLSAELANGGLVVDLNPALDGLARGAVVSRLVSGGVRVDRVTPRRRLEDVFLRLVGEDR
ncbi:alpha/beta fold hydrolase [Fodinicola acaciae]|uniref:alpha/beta fold hydrolase n=1 Tax=Fodinicola acaciae TaxID=2681555 RepID=UPI0013D03604|nr:alpha/beta fold hydrolase [Fodinicola acaciae]